MLRAHKQQQHQELTAHVSPMSIGLARRVPRHWSCSM
ncbi:unnamed protein product [Penicillium roqueforti FM164]|uniref:Genomic scaffold, ProqFM164S02 n=1 Tax=Penicillium roqueforti (strain FM164) TaxID=1365484 RepID=W6Q320_PENRF|nr:unnamed protein product [Penicillium roqueforti FM164]